MIYIVKNSSVLNGLHTSQLFDDSLSDWLLSASNDANKVVLEYNHQLSCKL